MGNTNVGVHIDRGVRGGSKSMRFRQSLVYRCVPVSNLPESSSGRFGQGLTAKKMKTAFGCGHVPSLSSTSCSGHPPTTCATPAL